MDFAGAGPYSTEKHNLHQVFFLYTKKTLKKHKKCKSMNKEKLVFGHISLAVQHICSLLGMDSRAYWSSQGFCWCPTCWCWPSSAPRCSWGPSSSAWAPCEPTRSQLYPHPHFNFLFYTVLFFLSLCWLWNLFSGKWRCTKWSTFKCRLRLIASVIYHKIIHHPTSINWLFVLFPSLNLISL